MSFKDFYTRNFKRDFSKFYFEEKRKKKKHSSVGKTYAYRWVNKTALPYIARYGILGYAAAYNNPDVVSGLGDLSEEKLSTLIQTGDGPMLLVAPPPSNDILSLTHPVITKKLQLIAIDIESFIADNPDVSIKFVDHDGNFDVTSMQSIQKAGTAWDKYDRTHASHEYAPNVPKIMIGTPSTIIDSKYISY